MAKIKRYSIKAGTTIGDIKATGGRDGGTWINKEAILWIEKYLPCIECSIDVAFKENITDWDDFENVTVLDNNFCQPYTPFYGENYGKEITGFPMLEYCIEEYNQFMDSLSFLEEKRQ